MSEERSDRRCATCKWWSRHELGPQHSAACRVPIAESVYDYIREMEVRIPRMPLTSLGPVLLKLADSGRSCPAWEPNPPDALAKEDLAKEEKGHKCKGCGRIISPIRVFCVSCAEERLSDD